MNITDFIQTGGFPLKAERLQELQKAYSIFNALGNIAGNLTIISGCELTGTTISDGIVFIDGEVYDFRSSYVDENSRVIIVEENSPKAFENGESKNVHTIRFATFGTAEISYSWTEFKKPFQTKNIPANFVERLDVLEKKTAVFQQGGGMVLWNKPANQIPEGWQEVVDWRGRIPVGFDNTQAEFNALGKLGGSKTKTLTVGEMPQHDHYVVKGGYEAGASAIHTQKERAILSYTQDVYNGSSSVQDAFDVCLGSTTQTADAGKSSKSGNGQAFSILNPYRVVMFIEYKV